MYVTDNWLYHPDKIHQINKSINLMCTEQTVVWFLQYEKNYALHEQGTPFLFSSSADCIS